MSEILKKMKESKEREEAELVAEATKQVSAVSLTKPVAKVLPSSKKTSAKKPRAKKLQPASQGTTNQPVIQKLELTKSGDWLLDWDPEKDDPRTDGIRIDYAVINGITSRDDKMILRFLAEHYNTQDAISIKNV